MTKHFSLLELATFTGAQLIGNADLQISGVNTLEFATEQELSFLSNSRYEKLMKDSKAGAICVDFSVPLVDGKNFLVSKDPSYTFQLIVRKFLADTCPESGFQDMIHPTAIIHPSAKIHKSVTIAPHVVVDAQVTIDEGTRIYPFVSIGPGVKIGKQCTFYSSAVIREGCVLGNNVILQPGAVIGSCGFGYSTNRQTGCHVKIEQMGCVVIEDDVEIGVHSVVERARFKETRIKKGAKIGSLVCIAHNVKIGKNVLIIAQVGIAGSVTIGDNVTIAAQSGFVGHISICDNVMFAARSGVTKSINKPGIYGGAPAISMAAFKKREIASRKVVKVTQDLKKRIEELESKPVATR